MASIFIYSEGPPVPTEQKAGGPSKKYGHFRTEKFDPILPLAT